MSFKTNKVFWHIQFSVVVAMVSLLGSSGAVLGQDVQGLTRIEEDWVVAIVEPDSEITAPQFTSVMTPDHNDPATYFTVEFNHSTSPEFTPGGIQLQTWTNDAQDDASPRLTNRSLDERDERIRWTQYLEIKNDNLEFGLSGFRSRTWNGLALDEAKLTVFASALQNLNNYRIVDSAASSGVGYSANRVESMILVRVRTYSGNQLLETIEVNKNLLNGSE